MSRQKHLTTARFRWTTESALARRPRIHLPGLPIHLVQRGHNREACFFSADDFLAYREWLGEALQKTGCAVHAYVLMTNHVHLLLTPPSAQAVAQLVISLGRRYVHYINKTYHRTGTLWDSRYKSSLVHADDYLLLCQRYIELNPVRASMAGSGQWAGAAGRAVVAPCLVSRLGYQCAGTAGGVSGAIS